MSQQIPSQSLAPVLQMVMTASSVQILPRSCRFFSLSSFMWLFFDCLSGNMDWSPSHSLNHLTVLLFRFMPWKCPVQVSETSAPDTDSEYFRRATCECQLVGSGWKDTGKAQVSWWTRHRKNESEMRKMAQLRLLLPWRPFPQTRESRELRLLGGQFKKRKCVPF